MKTLFDEDRKRFSRKAHFCAEEHFYPNAFKSPRKNLAFQETAVGGGEVQTILDGQMGIDYLVKIRREGLKDSVPFTVQERWREKEYHHRGDLTVTEWNYKTDQPSELYKLQAQIFVYGYYDSDRNEIIEAVAVNAADMLCRFVDGSLDIDHEIVPRKQQSFVAVTIEQLISTQVYIYHYIHATIEDQLKFLDEPIELRHLWHSAASFHSRPTKRQDDATERLYPFLGKEIMTPAGPGTLLQVFATQVDVVLHSAPEKLTIFAPEDIEIMPPSHASGSQGGKA